MRQVAIHLNEYVVMGVSEAPAQERPERCAALGRTAGFLAADQEHATIGTAHPFLEVGDGPVSAAVIDYADRIVASGQGVVNLVEKRTDVSDLAQDGQDDEVAVIH